MVVQKRLDYGFNGYQVPATPRATRSARKRCPFKKRIENNQMCAFDLLASVAGKLLHREIMPSNNTSSEGNRVAGVKDTVKRERQDEAQSPKLETCYQGSCEQRFVDSELIFQSNKKNYSPKQSPSYDKDSNCELVSKRATSDCSRGFDNQKLLGGKIDNEIESLSPSSLIGSYCFDKLQGANKAVINDETDMEGNTLINGEDNACHLEDTVAWDGNPSVPLGSNSSARAPSCGDYNPHRSGPASQDEVNVFSKDDDENSSGCTHPSNIKRPFRPAPQIGDRRIRKVLASKHWNASPKLNKVSRCNFEEDLKPACRERENYFKRLRSERNFPFKKRKFFHSSFFSNSDGGASNEGTSESPGKHIHADASSSGSKMHGASGVSCSVAEQCRSFNSRDSSVKLRIMSFRVPELFIEIPETATVGLLKRTVMEAVTAILGGGLRIGILLQGKKVKDDNKTLLQTGISQGNQLDSLGFSLEPNSFQTPQCLHPEDSHLMLSCDAPQPPNRLRATSGVVCRTTSVASPEHHVRNLDNLIEGTKAFSPIDISVEKSSNESKALVPVPAMRMEALAVVPAHRKSKRPEVVQRRIRRPFSVAEVEALVQAVEKLGTGRWRDVKLRAFDNAKHRTYVDLKDKWKTLVHTARISPQQRRGEPVPQELLDRVLTAHAYWSQQQAKQQLKQQLETCLLL